jgi:hypothetical protein
MKRLVKQIAISLCCNTGKALQTTSLMTLLCFQSVFATIFTDTTGELFGTHPNLDIVSVEITNDLTDITFIITVSEDPLTNDWGRYMIAIDSQAGGLTNYNAWYPRPISLSSGLEYWFGCWIEGTGGRELYHWRDDIQAFDVIPYFGGNPVAADNSISASIPLASLGLSDGDTFVFDVFTSDGGVSNSAVDALSDPAETISNWLDPYVSVSALTYTVGEEPPPPAATLIIDREITGIVHHYTPPDPFFPGSPAYVTDELLFDTNGLSNIDLSQYDSFKLRLHAPAGGKIIVDHAGSYSSWLNVYYHNFGQPDSSSHTETTTLEFEQFTGLMPSNTYSFCNVGNLGNVLNFDRQESYSGSIEFSAMSYSFTATYNPTNFPKDFIQRSYSSIPVGFSRQTMSTNDPGPFVQLVTSPSILMIDREITGIVHHYTPPDIIYPGSPAYVTDELLFDTNGLSNIDLSQYDSFKLRLHAPVGRKITVDHTGSYTSGLNVYYHNYGQPDSSSHTETTLLEFEQFAGLMPSNTYSLCYIGDLGNVLKFNRSESYMNPIEFKAMSYSFTAAYNPANFPKNFIQRSHSSIPVNFGYQTSLTHDPGPFVAIAPGADTDRDGQSDEEELIAGSDPGNSNTYFHVQNVQHEASGFVISWEPCVTGRWYEVLWISELTDSPLSLAGSIEYPQNSYTDTTHSAEDSGFYKVRVELK